MESPLGFLAVLAIIIFSAKAAGYASVRLHQPAVLGELLMGLILGPTIVDLFALQPFAQGNLEETIFYLAEAGVIFLMFMAGLQIDISEMGKLGKTAVLTGTMGILVPLILGTIVALGFSFGPTSAVFVGLILTATSVSISAQTLLELGLVRTREGLTLLAAAVVDDIIVLLLFSAFIAVSGSEAGDGFSAIAGVVLRMALFLVIASLIGILILPHLTRRVSSLPISEGLVAAVIVVTLLYGWAAEALGGMAAITGAFLAGLMFARTPLRKNIEEGIHTITYGLLVPIFFVSIGMRANARTLDSNAVLFTLLIVAVAIFGKIIGCGIGARLGGFNNREALRVGTGMVARGEVELIVASVGLKSGLIPASVFSTTVIVVLVTALLAPILIRATFQGRERT
jgi:Kef-type K+ transport system membrane component KefB